MVVVGIVFVAIVFGVWGMWRYPLYYEPIHVDGGTVAHLVIVGFGPAGQRVALQAARTGYFANERRSNITVLDRVGSPRVDDFVTRFPNVEEVVGFNSVEICPLKRRSW